MKKLILLSWICILTLSCASLKNIFAPEQPKDIGEKLAEENLKQAQKDRPQFKIFKPCPSDVKPTSYFSLYKSGRNAPTFVELRNITPKMIVQKTMEKDRAFDRNFAKLVVNLEFKDGHSIYRTFSVQGNSWTRFSDKIFTESSNTQFKGNLPNTITAEYSNGSWQFPDSPYLFLPAKCSMFRVNV